MKLISHRGNIRNPFPRYENTEKYIKDAIDLGYFVEIDIWFYENKFFLGHDFPKYETSFDFINSNKLFVHCKNGDALFELLKLEPSCEFFWHQHDDYILTSNKHVWVEPGKELLKNSICCLPEKGYVGNLEFCYGICSDYIENYLPLLAPR